MKILRSNYLKRRQVTIWKVEKRASRKNCFYTKFLPDNSGNGPIFAYESFHAVSLWSDPEVRPSPQSEDHAPSAITICYCSRNRPDAETWSGGHPLEKFRS